MRRLCDAIAFVFGLFQLFVISNTWVENSWCIMTLSCFESSKWTFFSNQKPFLLTCVALFSCQMNASQWACLWHPVYMCSSSNCLCKVHSLLFDLSNAVLRTANLWFISCHVLLELQFQFDVFAKCNYVLVLFKRSNFQNCHVNWFSITCHTIHMLWNFPSSS